MIKKLLIITPIYPPVVGGPAQYIEKLVTKLPKEYQINIVCLGKENVKQDNFEQISIYTNPLLRQLKLFITIWKNLKIADIAYVQGTLTVGFASMIACKLLDKKYVLKYVGDEVWEKYQSNGGTRFLDEYLESKKSFFDNILFNLEKIILTNAQKVIVPGEYLQQVLAKHFHIKAINIPNAVEIPKIKMLAKKSNSIIYVGRLVPWKQVDKVLKAFKKLQSKENNKWSMTIAGDGIERENLERMVSIKKMYGVTFMGSISKQQVLSLMCKHEYLVLYSTYEGMSHTLLDGMGLGLKIVASDILANRTILKDGEYGKLVSPNILNDLSNAFTGDYDPKMLDNAKDYVSKNHNWDKHVNLLLKQIL